MNLHKFITINILSIVSYLFFIYLTISFNPISNINFYYLIFVFILGFIWIIEFFTRKNSIKPYSKKIYTFIHSIFLFVIFIPIIIYSFKIYNSALIYSIFLIYFIPYFFTYKKSVSLIIFSIIGYINIILIFLLIFKIFYNPSYAIIGGLILIKIINTFIGTLLIIFSIIENAFNKKAIENYKIKGAYFIYIFGIICFIIIQYFMQF